MAQQAFGSPSTTVGFEEMSYFCRDPTQSCPLCCRSRGGRTSSPAGGSSSAISIHLCAEWGSVSTSGMWERLPEAVPSSCLFPLLFSPSGVDQDSPRGRAVCSSLPPLPQPHSLSAGVLSQCDAAVTESPTTATQKQ